MNTLIVPIGSVIPYARNPRRNEVAIRVVATSIREYGFRQPIVVDKERVIIVGHTRLEAARSLGLQEVPIVVADHLTSEQVKAYRIADNKLHEIAEWDRDKLTVELKDLESVDYDLTLTALYESEIDILLATQEGNRQTLSMAQSSAEKISKFHPPNFVVGKFQIPMSQFEVDALKRWSHSYVEEKGTEEGMLTALLDLHDPEVEAEVNAETSEVAFANE